MGELAEALSLTLDAYQAIAGQAPQGEGKLPRLEQGRDFEDASEMKKR